MSRSDDNLPGVRVIHGAGDGQFTLLVGKTVGSARASLARPFNIPPHAPAFVNGERVGQDCLLRADDTLEFVLPWGVKGLGDLLTQEELMSRWRVTEDQYRELLDLGLPTIHLGGGAARHPELAVDEWCRQRWQVDREPPAQGPGGDRPGRWCHPASAMPPPSYPFGPIHGTQAELASWLYGDSKPDARRLHGKGASGAVWVRKDHARRYEVWFRTERELAEARRRQGQTAQDKA